MAATDGIKIGQAALAIGATILITSLVMSVTMTKGEKKQQQVVTQQQEPPKEEYDCSREPIMTNEQIVATAKMCKDAGLYPNGYHCGDNPFIFKVQCETAQ